MERADQTRSLPPIMSVVRHHVVLIFTPVLLALSLVVFYVVNLPASYTASSVILLSPAPGNPLTAETASSSSLQMTVALETETQLARTPAVSEVVSKELGRTVPDLGESLQISVPSNTQMLRVSFTSSTPERAREGSQAFADGYLKYRSQRAETIQEARIQQLKGQIADTDGNLRRAIGEAGSSPYASQEVLLFVDRLAALNNSVSAAELISTYPGSVTSAPMLPVSANGLPAWILALAAVAFGLLAGVALAFWREWRRDFIREDITADLGVPLFATIDSQENEMLATRAGSKIHESYRQLRTAVVANAPRPYTLAVTAVGGESGSALSAEVGANLAVVLAHAKFSVLLVITDSRQRRVEELLGVEVGEGLTDVVLRGVPAYDSLVRAEGISVLTAGREVDGAADLTATSDFGSVVDELRQHFDYTIVAAASAGSSDGDAALLVADSVLLLLTPDVTTRTLLSVILDRLQNLGVETLGAVRVSLGHGPQDRSRNRDIEGKRGTQASGAAKSSVPKVVDAAH